MSRRLVMAAVIDTRAIASRVAAAQRPLSGEHVDGTLERAIRPSAFWTSRTVCPSSRRNALCARTRTAASMSRLQRRRAGVPTAACGQAQDSCNSTAGSTKVNPFSAARRSPRVFASREACLAARSPGRRR